MYLLWQSVWRAPLSGEAGSRRCVPRWSPTGQSIPSWSLRCGRSPLCPSPAACSSETQGWPPTVNQTHTQYNPLSSKLGHVKISKFPHENIFVWLHECMCPHQQVTRSCVHVLVHEVQDGEPQGSKGGQGQQRWEVLEENLDTHQRQLLSQLLKNTDMHIETVCGITILQSVRWTNVQPTEP